MNNYLVLHDWILPILKTITIPLLVCLLLYLITIFQSKFKKILANIFIGLAVIVTGVISIGILSVDYKEFATDDIKSEIIPIESSVIDKESNTVTIKYTKNENISEEISLDNILFGMTNGIGEIQYPSRVYKQEIYMFNKIIFTKEYLEEESPIYKLNDEIVEPPINQ